MRDLSLHLMDIVQNSIRAQAKLIIIRMEYVRSGELTLMVKDDGLGMKPELLSMVQNPFTTTRTERKIGLGIPLFTENARLTGGDVHIDSTPGMGTTVTAVFHTRHIDCIPLGDIAGTMAALVAANAQTPDFDFLLTSNGNEASLDTRVMRQALQEIALNEPEIVMWMRSSLQEEIQQVFGGTDYEIHR